MSSDTDFIEFVPTAWPSSGQFVAVWKFDDVVWASTYKWVDDKLYVFEEERWEEIRETELADITCNYNAKFYISIP